jgi:hypothetical protein
VKPSWQVSAVELYQMGRQPLPKARRRFNSAGWSVVIWISAMTLSLVQLIEW